MVESIQLMEFALRMLRHLHHAPQVGVLFVASEHFQLAPASDQHQRGSIGPHMKERRILVDDGLLTRYSALFARRKVGNGMPAVWQQPRDLVGIEVVLRQVALVQADHAGEITARRMT